MKKYEDKIKTHPVVKELMEVAKYIPFTFEDRDELRGKWVRHKESHNEFMIYLIGENHVNGHSWEESLEEFEFLDGTPFGKLN